MSKDFNHHFGTRHRWGSIKLMDGAKVLLPDHVVPLAGHRPRRRRANAQLGDSFWHSSNGPACGMVAFGYLDMYFKISWWIYVYDICKRRCLNIHIYCIYLIFWVARKSYAENCLIVVIWRKGVFVDNCLDLSKSKASRSLTPPFFALHYNP